MTSDRIRLGTSNTLGNKALVIFILQYTLPAFAIFIVSAFFLIFNSLISQDVVSLSLSALPQETTVNFNKLFDSIALGGIAISVIFLCIGFLIAWLTYINYRYIFHEHALEIERGILYKDIVSIPYRQVQNVDIKRSLLYRFFGISKIIIETAGHEDYNSYDEKGEGVISVMDKYDAEALREVLLGRTHIQEVRHSEKK